MGRAMPGGAEQLGASYHALYGELRGLFRARGVPADDSGDLAQETILRTLVHLNRHGRTRSDLGPLARTIARNLLVERLRRTQHQVVALPEDADVVDEAPGPFDELLAAERREDVQRAIAELAPRHRRVVALWMQGMSPAEIASKLGIKRNAADALLHRARRRLAAQLAPHSVTGVFGLIWLRIRSGVRTAIEALPATGTPGFSLAEAGAGLAALSIAAAVVISSTGQSPNETQSPSQKVELRAEQVARPSRPHVTTTTGETTSRDADGRETVAARRDGTRIGFEADPGPGANDETGAGIDHRRDNDGDRGMIGPLVDRAADVACGAASGAC